MAKIQLIKPNIFKKSDIKKMKLSDSLKGLLKLLNKGSLKLPDDTIVVNLATNGNPTSAGIIADRIGTLKPIIVLSDSEFTHLSESEEDELVMDAVSVLPEYFDAKLCELPFFVNNKSWLEHQRLGLFPLTMLAD